MRFMPAIQSADDRLPALFFGLRVSVLVKSLPRRICDYRAAMHLR